MSFLPPLEMRPSSIAPNPVESRETPPNSSVSLTSQRQDLPEITGTSRGNQGFPAPTRKRPRGQLVGEDMTDETKLRNQIHSAFEVSVV